MCLSCNDDWGDLHSYMKGRDAAKAIRYMKNGLTEGQYVQYWEIWVDIFPGAPIWPEELKLTPPLPDGMWLLY